MDDIIRNMMAIIHHPNELCSAYHPHYHGYDDGSDGCSGSGRSGSGVVFEHIIYGHALRTPTNPLRNN